MVIRFGTPNEIANFSKTVKLSKICRNKKKFPGFLSSLLSSNFGSLKTNMRQFGNNIFFMKNFEYLVAQSKLRTEAGHYLLFHIVQGAHHRNYTGKFSVP